MSKTIDERVVSLEFNNSKFEENAKTTILSLNQLKQSLNFEGAAKGLDNIDQVSKRVDLSTLNNAVSHLKIHFTALDVIATTALSNITTSVMRTGASLVNSLISPITSGGFTRALRLEQARFQFKGLGMDVTEAMENCDYAVAGTAYSLDAAAAACGSLGASGVKLGDDMRTALRGISGVAAMTSSSYEEIANVFTRVAGNGRVMAIDLQSLSSRGLNAAAELAKAFGVTEAEIRDMISKGKVSFAEFAEAMDKAFGEHAKDANETYSGSLSNVRAALAKIGAETATVKLEVLTGVFNKLRLAINEFKVAIMPVLTLIGNGMRVLGKQAEDVLDKLKNVFQNGFKGTVAEVLSSAADENWAALSKRIEECGLNVDNFKKSLEEVGKKHGALTDEMINKAGSLEGTLREGWMTTDIFSEALNKVSKSAKELSGATETTTEKVENFESVVMQVIRGDFGNGADRVKALTEAGYDYATIQDMVNKTIWGQAVSYEVATKSVEKNTKAQEDQRKALEKLKKEAKSSNKDLSKLIEDMKSPPSGSYLLIESMKNGLKAVSQYIGIVKSSFSNVFQFDAGNILYVFVAKLYSFSEGLILTKDPINKFINGLTGIFSVLKLIGKLSVGKYLVAFQLAKETLDEFNTTALDTFEALGLFLDQFVKIIEESGFLEASFELLVSLGEVLITVVRGLIEVISSFIGEAKEIDYISNSVEYLTSAFQWLTTKVKEITKNVKDFNTKLRESKNWQTVGKTLGSIFKDVSKFAGEAFEVVKSGSKAGLKVLKDLFEKLQDGFKWLKEQEWFQNTIETLSTGLKNLKDMVVSTFDGISSSSGNIFDGIGSINLPQAFSGVMSDLSDAETNISGKLSSISKAFGSFFNGGIFEDGKKWLDDFIAKFQGFSLSPSKIFGPVDSSVNTGVEEVVNSVNGTIGSFGVSLESSASSFLDLLSSHLDLVITAGAGLLVKKTLDTANTFMTSATKAMDALGGFLKGFNKNFEKYIDVKQQQLKIQTILSVAAGVLAIAGAIYLIAQIDPSRIVYATGIIAITLGALVGVVFLLEKFGKGKAKDYSAIVASFGASILMLSIAIKMVAGLEVGAAWNAVGILSVLILELTAVCFALSLMKGPVESGAAVIVAFGISMILMTWALKSLAKIDTESLYSNLGGLVALCVLMIGMYYVLSRGTSTVAEAFVSLLLMVVSMKLLLTLVDDIAAIEPEEAIKAIEGLGVLIAAIAALMLSTRLAGKEIEKAGIVVLELSLAVFVLAYAVKALGELDEETLKKGIAATGALTTMVSALVYMTKFAGDINKDTFIGMATAMAILAIVCAILGYLDEDAVKQGLVCVGALTAFMSALMYCSQFIPDKKIVGKLIGMTLVIAALALILVLMNDIDGVKALENATALTEVIVGISAAMKILDKVDISNEIIAKALLMVVVVAAIGAVLWAMSQVDIQNGISNAFALSMLVLAIGAAMKLMEGSGSNAFKGWKPEEMLKKMAIMVGVVAALGLVIAVMGQFDIQGAIPNAIALSILLLALSASVAILSEFGGDIDKSVMITIGILTLALAGIAAILGVMGGLDVHASIGDAIALSILLAALSVCCVILSTIESFDTTVLVALACLELAMLGLVAIFMVINSMNVQFSMGNVLALSTLIMALSAACILLEIAGFAGSAALWGVAALDALIVSMLAIMGTIAYLNQYVPDLQTCVEQTIPIMQALGEGLGAFIGGFLGGAITGLAESLPNLGTQLASFGENLGPFIDATKQIDQSALDGMVRLAEMVALFSGAGFLDSITSFFTGSSSLTTFGVQLVEFAKPLKAFAELTSDIDASHLQGVSRAAKCLAEFASALPSDGGWLQGVIGHPGSLKSFAVELVSFAAPLKLFAESTKGIDVSEVQNAANAAKALIEIKDVLPKEGGWLQQVIGEPGSLKKFAEELAAFGPSFVEYANTVSGITPDVLDASTTAAKSLVALKENLPASGGFLQDFLGEKSMSDFGKELEDFGKSMVQYQRSVQGLKVDAIYNSIQAAGSLVELNNLIPNMGNLWDELCGSGNDMSKFGNELANFGQALCSYGNAIVGIPFSMVDASVISCKNLIQFLDDISNKTFPSASDFKTALSNLSSIGVQAFIDEFNNQDANAESAGQKFADSAISGMRSGLEAGKALLIFSIISLSSTFRGYYSSFYSAGSYMISGLVAGMSSQSSAVVTTARNIAQSAYEAAKKALKVESPSKKFFKLGYFTVEGFIQSVKGRVSDACEATKELANSSISAFSDAMDILLDEMDEDGQLEPVITPIVDLSYAKSGINELNSYISRGNILSADLSTTSRINRNAANDSVSMLNEAVGKLVNGLSNTNGNSTIEIHSHLYVDGEELAHDVAPYMRRELNAIDVRRMNLKGFKQ